MLFSKITGDYYYDEGTRWRSWLRHCATIRKVAGSIPEGIIEIFHWQNPSGRTMALGLTQPLTEMSTRNISWGIKSAGAYGWQPYRLHVLIVSKSGRLNFLEPSGPDQACNELLYPYYYDDGKHTDTLSRQSTELMNVKLGGTYINHCALKGNVYDYS